MVTADPLTLCRFVCGMGELKHSFKKEAKHSFKYALLKLPIQIRSPAQAKKSPRKAGKGHREVLGSERRGRSHDLHGPEA